MMSSAMDASSLQVDDDDVAQSSVQEVVSFTDTLHTILVGFPRWRSTLVCLRLKMKVAVCCGNAQNPFLLTQPGYTEQKTQFVDELFEQSLVTVHMTRDDLEKGQGLVDIISSKHIDSFQLCPRTGQLSLRQMKC